MADQSYWLKQTKASPLFPDLIWSRPETKKTAGKLLIIGGSSHSFASPAEAYASSLKAGVGTTRVILPEALAKTLTKLFPEAEYAPSNLSGSLAKEALGPILAASHWADGVLLAGDFGKNSETAILLEWFLSEFKGQVTLTQDSLDYFINLPETILSRSETLLVLSFNQLQKLATSAKFIQAFTSDMGILKLVSALHDFSQNRSAAIFVEYGNQACLAYSGQVSTTPIDKVSANSLIKTAAAASVWWLQNPSKLFESVTSSLV